MQPRAIVSFLLLLFHNVCCTEDTWTEPYDWTKITPETIGSPGEELPQSCQFPVHNEKSLASIEDQLALIYFKKFVISVFDRNKLRYSKTSKLYKRSVMFTLLPSELEQIESTEDVRDLDILLSKILDKAVDKPLILGNDEDDYSYTHKGMGVLALIVEMSKDSVYLLKHSEVQFLLIVLLAIALGWFVRKRYRIPVIVIVIGGVFIFGYFHTYLECNRKLEADEMIEVLNNHKHQSENGPRSWFSNMVSYFNSESPEVRQKNKLLKSSKLNLPFCRPDHVFIMYTSDMFLKQIETLLEKTTETITKLTGSLSFPFNLIVPFALVFLIGYMLKFTFKYIISPKVWMGLVNKSSAPSSSIADAGSDRISGENLKMLLAVAANKTSIMQPKQLAVSGVQEVQEPTEALPAPPSQPVASIESPPQQGNTSSEKPNVSSSSADTAKEAGFTIVDDNDDAEDFH